MELLTYKNQINSIDKVYSMINNTHTYGTLCYSSLFKNCHWKHLLSCTACESGIWSSFVFNCDYFIYYLNEELLIKSYSVLIYWIYVMISPWRNGDAIPHKQRFFYLSGLKGRSQERGNRDFRKWKLTGLLGHTPGRYHN